MDKKNPFSKYELTTSKHIIEALDGAEITLRTLSEAEASRINALMFGSELDENGRPTPDIEGFVKARVERVSAALVEPKMSVKELRALGSGITTALVEINEIIQPTPVLDTEGNLEDSQA